MTQPPRGWIVSPAFDLLFLANVYWVVALVPILADGPTAPLGVWQLFFVTTAHRWITLLLVAADPDRRAGRDRLFVGLAVAAVLLVAGVYLGTGSLKCLLLIDWLWNAWHFGSQHAGVLRMYDRTVGGGWPTWERHGVRLFVLYVAVRVPAETVELLAGWSEALRVVRVLDTVAFVVPVVLLGSNLWAVTRARVGKLVYVMSFCGVYVGLLAAVMADEPAWAVRFALASALFHATEYLAVVTHYARRRESIGSAGLFRRMAGQWLVVLIALSAGLALLGLTVGSVWVDLWVGLNLVAAFLHYAYDGLIWKLRRPETAAVLNVGEAS